MHDNHAPVAPDLQQSKSSTSRKFLLPCLTVLWLLALVPGFHYLFRYENAPGRQGTSPSAWQSKALPAGDARLPTLLVALHPRCSCSNATLSELQDAALSFGRPYNAIFLIDPPTSEPFDWHQIRSYRDAQQALHANVIIDHDGKLASQFGAFTSGEVLLYSAEDRSSSRSLLFAGGVTAGRGMIGENSGVAALEAAFRTPITTLPGRPAKSPVFGCGLLTSVASTERKVQ